MTSAPDTLRERHATLLWRLIASQQWDRALAAATDWLAEEPDAADAHQSAGHALVNLGRHEPALVHIRRVLAARPDDSFAHRLASVASFHLRLYPQADAHIMEAIRLRPDEPHHWYHLALMGYERRHYDAAAGYARRSLALAPDNADTVNLLALCERNDPVQRRVHYQRALALDPENALVHNNLGVHHLNETRDYAAAADCFRRALSINPADANAQRNLVLAFRLGDALHRFLRFPRRFFLILSFRREAYSWRSVVWFGLCALSGGAALLILLVIYGGWLTCGLPMLKAYEAVTLPDLRERAGVPGARRGGPLRFWRWPRWVRVGLLFAAYAASVCGLWQACQRFGVEWFLLATLAGGGIVTLVHAFIACWQFFYGRRDRRRMEKKFAGPPPLPTPRPEAS